MLAALYLHGIQPGPRLMADQPELVYALVWAAVVASVLILPLGLLLAAPLGLVTRVRPPYLVPSVILLCLVGTYSVRNSVFDVGLMLLFGVLGFLMRRRDYPIVPLVLGLVLGPIAEENLLRALQLGRYKLAYFIDSPMAIGLWLGFAALLVYGVVKGVRRRRRARADGAGSTRERPAVDRDHD